MTARYTNTGELETAQLYYEILKLGERVGKPVKTLKQAMRMIDRLDLAYGASVHSYRTYHTFECA